MNIVTSNSDHSKISPLIKFILEHHHQLMLLIAFSEIVVGV